jgi:hypothetical protein
MTCRLAIVSCMLSACFAPSIRAAEWQVSATNEVAVEIAVRQTPVVKSNYMFWGENWKWMGLNLKPAGAKAGQSTFSAELASLGLTIGAVVDAPAPNQLRIVYTIEATRDITGITGGGLEFNLALDNPALEGKSAEPVLLENNTGWRWSVGSEGLSVVFDKPIANVYFERGQKNKIRAMLVGSELRKGTHNVTMAVTLPKGGAVARSLADRYGPVDTSDWYRDAMRHDVSPVDLGFLNHKPAGKHGFVRAEGDGLVFADGTPARFWGGNIAAYAIHVEDEQIRQQAKRIAQLGYNLMRIHHHDSSGWVSRTVIDKTRDDSRHLDAEVMDRLDLWIKCLKDEGVYVWLDLHVGRMFKEGDEIGPGWSDMKKADKGGKGAEGKGYCYFNERIEQLMHEFNQKYLEHVNPYTRLAYKDDPSVMGLLITNENDLTCHFGNMMLGDKGNPHHNKIFEAAVRQFVAKHGLPYDPTWRTWMPGPSKIFLADVEYQWNRRMLDRLEQLGVKVPVSTTQMWGGMILCGLPPLTASGIIDVHSYGDAEALSVNPRFDDNYVAYIASGQAYGKPVAITEWNVPYPAVDRFTAPLYVASISALQGWDAPMIYNYSQEAFRTPQRPSTWSTFSDVGISGAMPAAALAYRLHVGPAQKHYCLMLDREKLYYESSHPKTLAAMRTLVEQSKLSIGLPDVKELDWDEATKPAAGVQQVAELDRDFIPAGRSFVESDTGQLRRDWVKGVQTIDTEGTQAAQGWLGGETIELKQAAFRISTPKAVVAVSSLDGQPVGKSRKLLITALARVVASPGGKMPMLSEPVRGQIDVAGPAGLKLTALAADGRPLETPAAAYANGRYRISLPAAGGTHWFMLSN